MIEQALRRFCESKHRKLIVTGVTFVVGLLLVMPLVDSIRAGGDEKDVAHIQPRKLFAGLNMAAGTVLYNSL